MTETPDEPVEPVEPTEPVEPPPESPPPSVPKRAPKSRKWGALNLVIVGSIILGVANLAVWLRNVALDDQAFADAVTPLVADEEFTTALASQLTDRIFSSPAVEQRIADLLPSDNPLVATAVDRAAREFVDDRLRKVLQSDEFQALWREIVVRAHRRGIQVIEQRDGSVAINLTDALQRVDATLEERGIDLLSDEQIARASEIALVRADQLGRGAQAIDLAENLAMWLPLAVLALFGLALVVGPDRRRVLRWIAVGTIVTMVVTAVALRFGRRFLLDQIEIETRRHAVDVVWDGVFSSLFRQIGVLMVIALAILAYLWFSAPARRAERARRSRRSTPSAWPLGQLRVAIIAAAGIALLVVPTVSIRVVLTLVTLTALALLALERYAPASQDSTTSTRSGSSARK